MTQPDTQAKNTIKRQELPKKEENMSVLLAQSPFGINFWIDYLALNKLKKKKNNKSVSFIGSVSVILINFQKSPAITASYSAFRDKTWWTQIQLNGNWYNYPVNIPRLAVCVSLLLSSYALSSLWSFVFCFFFFLRTFSSSPTGLFFHSGFVSY